MKTQALRLVAAAGLFGAVMLPATAAHAVYDNSPTTVTAAGDPGGSAQGQGNGSGTLPFTGGDVVGLALMGSGLFAGGTAVVRVNRRRRTR